MDGRVRALKPDATSDDEELVTARRRDLRTDDRDADHSDERADPPLHGRNDTARPPALSTMEGETSFSAGGRRSRTSPVPRTWATTGTRRAARRPSGRRQWT